MALATGERRAGWRPTNIGLNVGLKNLLNSRKLKRAQMMLYSFGPWAMELMSENNIPKHVKHA